MARVMSSEAAASRLIPHPLNFAPIGAMALFGGACFTDRHAAFGVPLAAMLLSDLVIALLNGNYLLQSLALMPVIYGSFALIVFMGFWLRSRRTFVPLAAATLTASVLFFVTTNFGDWVLGPFIPEPGKDWWPATRRQSRFSRTLCWAMRFTQRRSSAAWC